VSRSTIQHHFFYKLAAELDTTDPMVKDEADDDTDPCSASLKEDTISMSWRGGGMVELSWVLLFEFELEFEWLLL